MKKVLNNFLNISLLYFTLVLTLATPQLGYAMETLFEDSLPKDARRLIVKRVAYELSLEEENPVTVNKTLVGLTLVCKEWQAVINDDMKMGQPIWKASYGVTPKNETIYQQFLNGVLIYKPDPRSNEGMILLKISDLNNPLEDTFDLSECGDSSKKLRISTGCRKEKKWENSDMLEIWIAPRFIIEKKLHQSFIHLQPILGEWNEKIAPIGILWNWGIDGDLSSYDYLVDVPTNVISSKDLYEHWKCSKGRVVWSGESEVTYMDTQRCENFILQF